MSHQLSTAAVAEQVLYSDQASEWQARNQVSLVCVLESPIVHAPDRHKGPRERSQAGALTGFPRLATDEDGPSLRQLQEQNHDIEASRSNMLAIKAAIGENLDEETAVSESEEIEPGEALSRLSGSSEAFELLKVIKPQLGLQAGDWREGQLRQMKMLQRQQQHEKEFSTPQRLNAAGVMGPRDSMAPWAVPIQVWATSIAPPKTPFAHGALTWRVTTPGAVQAKFPTLAAYENSGLPHLGLHALMLDCLEGIRLTNGGTTWKTSKSSPSQTQQEVLHNAIKDLERAITKPLSGYKSLVAYASDPTNERPHVYQHRMWSWPENGGRFKKRC
ncbi:hypothetical protein WJX73_000874 [Symbiochloris irregularis]|uniref:Uncharacterized protein n=1 Tax=Symbiochloris irregularis TaxID=706552 RepID=A0AAW1P7N3_9CHLO